MISLSNLFNRPKIDIKKPYQDGAIVIDVRSEAEFKTGHFANATNIPLDIIASKTASIKTAQRPVILLCRSGNRSGMATTILKNAGIEAYNGGAWNDFEAKIKQ